MRGGLEAGKSDGRRLENDGCFGELIGVRGLLSPGGLVIAS
jgi:hypothetical protein